VAQLPPDDTRPTPGQTLTAWDGQTSGNEAHFVGEVFPDGTSWSQVHRLNCLTLVRRGWLVPERDDGLAPYQRRLTLAELLGQRFMSTR
jgi:hypothetical protein